MKQALGLGGATELEITYEVEKTDDGRDYVTIVPSAAVDPQEQQQQDSLDRGREIQEQQRQDAERERAYQQQRDDQQQQEWRARQEQLEREEMQRR